MGLLGCKSEFLFEWSKYTKQTSLKGQVWIWPGQNRSDILGLDQSVGFNCNPYFGKLLICSTKFSRKLYQQANFKSWSTLGGTDSGSIQPPTRLLLLSDVSMCVCYASIASPETKQQSIVKIKCAMITANILTFLTWQFALSGITNHFVLLICVGILLMTEANQWVMVITTAAECYLICSLPVSNIADLSNERSSTSASADNCCFERFARRYKESRKQSLVLLLNYTTNTDSISDFSKINTDALIF